MDREMLPFIVLILLGIIITVVAQVGERLGWWHDFGDWATAAGIVLTIVGTGVAVVFGATRVQVVRVGDAVHEVRDEVHMANGKLDAANGKLDTHSVLLREQTAVLREIRDRLGNA